MRRWTAVGVGCLLVVAGMAAPAPREWTWEELARRAGARSDKAKVALLKSAARRQQVAEDRAWREPQLRLGHAWEDSRDRKYGEPPSNGDGASMATIWPRISRRFSSACSSRFARAPSSGS